MGHVHVEMKVGHPSGGDMMAVSEVMVDTGATHTILPESLLKQLHVEPVTQMSVRYADGSMGVCPCGQAKIALQGSDVELVCMVIFGAKDTYLVGATTLENFGMMVDPVGISLVPRTIKGRQF